MKIKCIKCNSLNKVSDEENISHIPAWKCFSCGEIWLTELYTSFPIKIIEGKNVKRS